MHHAYRLGISFCGLICVASFSSSADPAKAAASTPAEKKDDFWKKRHQAIVDLGKKGKAAVVFLGDSITEGWEENGLPVWKERFAPLKAANLGISGDRTQHVLWRITEGKELAGLEPELVVLLIGTNNLGTDRDGNLLPVGDSSEQIADGVAAIVAAIRKDPAPRVLVLGILPRAAEATAPVRGKIKEVNARLAKLDDGGKVRFLDVGGKFVDDKGNLLADLVPDGLHLSPKGYQVLEETLRGEVIKK